MHALRRKDILPRDNKALKLVNNTSISFLRICVSSMINLNKEFVEKNKERRRLFSKLISINIKLIFIRKIT